MNPVKFHRNDYCDCCKNERAIECYDTRDKPIGYSILLDRLEKDNEVLKILDKREVSYFRCRRCNVIYNVDWSRERGLCIPMRDNINIIMFLNDLRKK